MENKGDSGENLHSSIKYLYCLNTHTQIASSLPGRDFGEAGGEEALHQQGAAPVPGILRAASCPHPALPLQLLPVVEGLQLLAVQIEPALFHLWLQREEQDNRHVLVYVGGHFVTFDRLQYLCVASPSFLMHSTCPLQ